MTAATMNRAPRDPRQLLRMTVILLCCAESSALLSTVCDIENPANMSNDGGFGAGVESQPMGGTTFVRPCRDHTSGEGLSLRPVSCNKSAFALCVVLQRKKRKDRRAKGQLFSRDCDSNTTLLALSCFALLTCEYTEQSNDWTCSLTTMCFSQSRMIYMSSGMAHFVEV
jgi:hypothetical protein